MKRTDCLILAGIVMMALLASSLPLVAGDGPPPGKGNKKGDVGKSVEGFLYGDLYVIERDGNGQPVIYDDGPCFDVTTGIACAQPLMADCSYVPLMCQYEGDWTLDPELIACLEANGVADPLGNEDPENLWEPEACDLHPCFVDTIQEVHFGRMSVARTTPDVVLKAYIEALSTINSAVGVGQDLAGRIALDLPLLGEDGLPTFDYVDSDFDGVCDLDDNEALVTVDTYEKTIDSPLENLALYREMMINSCLGGVLDSYIGEGGNQIDEWIYLEPQAIALLIEVPALKHLVCDYGIDLADPPVDDPDDPSDNWWESPITPAAVVSFQDHGLAATFVAAAADKAGHVTLDMIINANSYLEINTVYQPNQGQAPEVTYHNFIEGVVEDASWYQYDATSAHQGEAFASLLTADSACAEGCFCIDDVYPFEPGFELVDFAGSAVPVCRGGQLFADSSGPYYCRSEGIETVNMTTFSLGLNSTAPGCGGANWFTQAAEDAREIVWFMHNWAVPEMAACVVP